MLSITDFGTFERFLNNAMDGHLNPLDLRADWKRSSGQPTSGRPVSLDFATHER